jgi:hypothetical protein
LGEKNAENVFMITPYQLPAVWAHSVILISPIKNFDTKITHFCLETSGSPHQQWGKNLI